MVISLHGASQEGKGFDDGSLQEMAPIETPDRNLSRLDAENLECRPGLGGRTAWAHGSQAVEDVYRRHAIGHDDQGGML
jgi:hypothetical protein